MSEWQTTGYEDEVEAAAVAPEAMAGDAVASPSPVVVEPAASQAAPTRQRALALGIAALVVVVDQLSKWLVEAALPLYQTWAPFPALASFFRITHVPNTGTAFGLFPTGSLFFAVMAVLVSLAIITYNFALPAGQRSLRFALGLQMGGAIGNLIDRMRLGHVTDFLDFGPWPVFNVADMAIVTGAILLGWLVLMEGREEQQRQRASRQRSEAGERHHELRRTVDEWSTD